MAKATDAAEKKAEAEGVDVEQLEGSGQDGQVTVEDVKAASGEGKKFLAFASPELGSYAAQVYPDGDPNNPRVFYRNPDLHPDGPQAQMVTEEEYAQFNHTIDGVFTLSRKGGES